MKFVCLSVYLSACTSEEPLPNFTKFTVHVTCGGGGGGEGLVTWLGRPSGASFGFYLREAFQSQTNTEKILYNKSR